ncbi:hypothetical protein JCM11641_005955, partial [Rhodosporidiobolus odoratus]
MAQFTLHLYVSAALDLTYESKYLDFDEKEQKSPEYIKINPNGRIPTLVDHENNDLAVSERNDQERHLTVGDSVEEQAVLRQWLFFQASGQGLYFGQAGHFKMFATEKHPYATDRYEKEVVRVLGGLESVLGEREWLVGGKVNWADLAFVTW